MNKIRTTLFSVSLLGCAAALAGCSTTSSDNVKTTGFYVTYSIAQQGTQKPTATATLQVGGTTGTYIDLSSSDSLTVEGSKLERHKSIVNSIDYSSTVDEKATYTFLLTRPGEPAYIRTITHPVPFTLTEKSTITAKYTDSVSVHWTVSGNPKAKVTVSVDPTTSQCTSRVIGSGLEDTGEFTFTADKLLPTDKSTPLCNYTMVVTRSLSSDIGSPFQGGTMNARHTESVGLSVGP